MLTRKQAEALKTIADKGLEWKTKYEEVAHQLATVTAERDRAKEAVGNTWNCFHCGFSTTDPAEAKAHFGDRDEEEPLCLTWNDLTSAGQASEYQHALMQIDAEREDNALLRTKIEGLEYRVESQISEIHSFAPFRQCDSVHQVFHVYDSMEGRALLAEEQLATVQAQRDEALAGNADLRGALERAIRALGFADSPEGRMVHFRDLITQLRAVLDRTPPADALAARDARVRREALEEAAKEVEKHSKPTDLRNSDRTRFYQAGLTDAIAKIRRLAAQPTEADHGR